MELTASDITYVRLLVTDTDGEAEIFTDAEIQAVASHERSLKRVAARLLLMIASSEVLIGKKIRTQDLQTDGPAVAEALRKLAADLRAEDVTDAEAELPALVVEPYVDNEACSTEPELTNLWRAWPF